MQVRAAFVSSGILAAMLVATAPMSLAQPQQYPDQPAYQAADQATDPPGRVARISVLRGDVSLEPAGVQQFSQAEINYPLTNGDRIYTDVGALAELQTAGLSVRLANAADLTVSTLTDQVAQFGLEQGSIRVRTSDLSAPDGTQGVVEIDTPNGTILVVSAGDIRVDAYPQNDTTVVTVTSGQVQVQGQNLNQTLGPNESIRLVGNPPAAQYLRLLPPDALDQFDQERDQQLQRDYAAEQDFVGPEMIGADELSQYGDWSASPDYGDVWYPRGVDVSWTPYQNGHWAWVAPWGWSWVDEAPWGFAPFHYGRWGHVGRRWCWIPSPRHRHAVYAPALVAWVGGPAAGGAMALGGGTAVGWVPLGPGEAYVPASRVTRRYFQDINGSNSVQNRYVNRDVPGALTVVPQSNFTAAQPVGRHRIAPPPQFQSGNFAARAPGIAPEHASVVGALSLNRVRTPPATAIDRPVVTHRPPPPAPPSFERQAPAIAANGGLPLDTAQLRALRGPVATRVPATTFAAPAAAVAAPAAAAATPAPGATVYRGIPERSPQFQAAPPPTTTNVFQQRDREIQEQRRAQQQDQPRRQAQPQTQQPFAPPPPPPSTPPPPGFQPQVAQPQVTPPRPRTDIRRAPPEPTTPAQPR